MKAEPLADVDIIATGDNYFEAFAPSTRANGYSVVPVYPATKQTAIGWRHACWSRADAAAVASQASAFPRFGVALACGRYTVAFDIDLTDEDQVRDVRAIVESVCGPTPLVRVGNAPKVALIYRSLEPIVSIRLPKLQIIGLGTMLMAYGTHPRTRRPYRWVGGAAPHRNALRDIPGVTNEQCEAVANIVARKLFGDRFERFMFDVDTGLSTVGLSSKSILSRHLLIRLFGGKQRAHESAAHLLAEGTRAPGYWGFVLRPVVKGGFYPWEAAAQIDHVSFGSSGSPDHTTSLNRGDD